jgi:hypothetical protein
LQEQQMKMLQQREAQGAAIKHLNDAYAAGNVESLPLFTDPLTGQQHRMLMNHQGEWYDPFTKARADAAKAQGKPEKVADEQGRTPQDYMKAQQYAFKTADSQIKDGTLKPEQRAAKIAEVMKEMGYKPSLSDHFAKPAKPNPFSITAPQTQPQQDFVRNWGMQLTAVRQSSLPPEQKQLAIGALQQVREITERYGIGAVPPAQQAEADKLNTMVENILREARGESSATPPPPPPGRSFLQRVGDTIRDIQPNMVS